MDDPRQHLGIARICESHGGQILIFPRRVVRLFGLQAGDEVGLRKRRGQSGYCVTFWRAGKRLSPLYNYPQLPPARPTKRGREGKGARLAAAPGDRGNTPRGVHGADRSHAQATGRSPPG